MARKYRYFSADSHFECLPETWTHRVPAKYRDRAPRRIKLADGRDAILDEGQPLEYRGTNLFAGKSPEEFNPIHLDFESSVGAGSPSSGSKSRTPMASTVNCCSPPKRAIPRFKTGTLFWR